MKLRHQVRYEASPDEVYAMLSDPAFRRRSCDARGVLSAEVSVEPTGSGVSVVVDQVQPTQGVPAFARKIAGDSTRAVQTEKWTDRTRATMTVVTPGKPTEITGTLTLEADGSGTVETFDGEVRAKVPLVGGKLESLVADLFTSGMDTESQVGRAWLEGER